MDYKVLLLVCSFLFSAPHNLHAMYYHTGISQQRVPIIMALCGCIAMYFGYKYIYNYMVRQDVFEGSQIIFDGNLDWQQVLFTNNITKVVLCGYGIVDLIDCFVAAQNPPGSNTWLWFSNDQRICLSSRNGESIKIGYKGCCLIIDIKSLPEQNCRLDYCDPSAALFLDLEKVANIKVMGNVAIRYNHVKVRDVLRGVKKQLKPQKKSALLLNLELRDNSHFLWAGRLAYNRVCHDTLQVAMYDQSSCELYDEENLEKSDIKVDVYDSATISLVKFKELRLVANNSAQVKLSDISAKESSPPFCIHMHDKTRLEAHAYQSFSKLLKNKLPVYGDDDLASKHSFTADSGVTKNIWTYEVIE